MVALSLRWAGEWLGGAALLRCQRVHRRPGRGGCQGIAPQGEGGPYQADLLSPAVQQQMLLMMPIWLMAAEG